MMHNIPTPERVYYAHCTTLGCRRLTKIQYAPETGMGDMPPVERQMAALTSLGPEHVTANPH